MRTLDLTGKTLGALKIIGRDKLNPSSRTGKSNWICLCACGTMTTKSQKDIKAMKFPRCNRRCNYMLNESTTKVDVIKLSSGVLDNSLSYAVRLNPQRIDDAIEGLESMMIKLEDYRTQMQKNPELFDFNTSSIGY